MTLRRRELITFLGGAAAWPVAAIAQQPGIPVVGYFYPGLEQAVLESAFRKGLSDLGFVEGRGVAIEYRFARNDPSRTAELMADLVRRRVAVVAATGGAEGALAAKAATSTIPIVFEIGDDPVQNGLVSSFNRPGGNLTGVSALNRVLDGKRLALLAELMPTAVRFGVLLSDLTSPDYQARLRDLPMIAASLGRQIETLVMGLPTRQGWWSFSIAKAVASASLRFSDEDSTSTMRQYPAAARCSASGGVSL